VIVAIVVFVYQQVENHVLQPVVYGKTVQLSPLLVLIAVLVGATIGGVFGVLLAIPIAGTLQVVVHDILDHRRKVLQT
jgi:predicted PurR-regulated permease PerM